MPRLRAWTVLLLGTLAALASPPRAQAEETAVWRLGFVDRGRPFLEVPPTDALCEEKDRLLLAELGGTACEVEPADRTPVPLPWARAELLRRSGLAARRDWWVLGLDGGAARVSLPRLVALYAEAGAAGCYYLAAETADGRPVEGPTEDNLLFGFSAAPARAPAVRRPTGDWELFERAEGRLPGRYAELLKAPELKAALGARHGDFAAEVVQVFSQPIDARLPGRADPEPVRLVGWAASGPRIGELATAWALVREKGGARKVAAAVHDASDDFGGSYRAELVAAVDLTGDGVDELVLSASYAEGGGIKVFGWLGGRLVQIYDGAYFGL